MNTRHWMIPSLMLAVSGCATSPSSTVLDRGVVAEAPTKAQMRSKVPAAPTQVAVAPAPTPAPVLPKSVALTPEMFEDANTTTNPSYTVASRTEPALIQTQPTYVPAQPAPVKVLPQAAIPQSVPSVGLPPQSAAPKRMAFLDKLEQSGAAPDGSYGFILIDAQNGTLLSERNADTPMPPASIAKLLAAVAVLETKGPNGTFRTSLHADGAISGGVLNGNLHMVGTGDPSLNRSNLADMGRQLAAAGVRSVSGNFYYHGDALPEVSMIDAAQPSGAIYNPGISGLNLEYNEARGSTPVRNPAEYTAVAMKSAAGRVGVTLPAPRRGSGPVQGSEIVAHDSAPLSAILTEMFDISRNMTAEVLGAAAANELGRKPTSLRDAASINAQWAQSRIGTIGGSEWSGFDFANNSGLSSRSRATPRQMAALVRYGYLQHGDTFKRIYEEQSAGSSAGVDFAIRAKIGTMRYVRGLGGLITVGGRDLVFAIMATDPSRRIGAKNWMGKARLLEQALMSDWLQNNWPSTQTAGIQ